MQYAGKGIPRLSHMWLGLTLITITVVIPRLAQAGPPPLVDVAPLDSTSGYTSFGGITADSLGNIYGTATDGAASGLGSVWELPHGANTITTLAAFNGANGEYPGSSPIVDDMGNIFGTTIGSGDQGQVSNYGNVYEIAHGTTTIQTIATFTNSTGRNASGGLVMDSNGNLYGTTLFGGAANYGTIFKIARGSQSIIPLASFSDAIGYGCSNAMVMDSNGNLYGACPGGGASENGSIFELPAGSNQIITLASFAGGNSGAIPQDGLLRDSKGNLFGVTSNVGRTGDGTVFELPAGSNTIITLAVFSGLAGNTPNFEVPVMDSKGDLFGTAENSNNGSSGTVWELPAGSNTIIPLAAFNSANGSGPTGTMVTDANGDLFGTTLNGGQNGDGVVWELAGVVPEPSAACSLMIVGAIACCFAGGRRSRRHSVQ